MNEIRHIAFVMDGNGRWASARGMPRSFGHIQGLKTAENVIEWCIKCNISIVSLYVFSTENWSRPKSEIDKLFQLSYKYISNFEKFCKDKIKVVVSGSNDRLPANLVKKICQIEQSTKSHNIITVNLCINYGGRQEIVTACNNILSSGGIISEQTLLQEICGRLVAPDLIVRTGGQMRLSNFLLYQSAYSELYFCDTLWPDITEIQLDDIIANYFGRTRNFGGLHSG